MMRRPGSFSKKAENTMRAMGDARLERPSEHLPDLVFRFLLAT